MRIEGYQGYECQVCSHHLDGSGKVGNPIHQRAVPGSDEVRMGCVGFSDVLTSLPIRQGGKSDLSEGGSAWV